MRPFWLAITRRLASGADIYSLMKFGSSYHLTGYEYSLHKTDVVSLMYKCNWIGFDNIHSEF